MIDPFGLCAEKASQYYNTFLKDNIDTIITIVQTATAIIGIAEIVAAVATEIISYGSSTPGSIALAGEGLGTIAYAFAAEGVAVVVEEVILEVGVTIAVGEAIKQSASGGQETSYGKSSSNISQLLSDRPELTGTNREKLLSTVQDNKLATYINEVYRPGASIGDGGTADALILEFYEDNSRHLAKAQERLVGINKIISSENLGLNDLDVAEALRDDLEYAIGLFK